MKAWMAPMARSNSFQTGSKTENRIPPTGMRPELPGHQEGQQGQHQAARQQVAEETEGQGERLGDLLDKLMKTLTGNRKTGNGWVT